MRKLSLNTGAGMSRQSKTAPQAKKVMPPAVPDIYGKVGSNNGTSSSAERGGEIKQSGTLLSTVAFDTPDGEARNGAGKIAGTIILEHHKNGTEGSSSAGTATMVPVVAAAAPSSLLLRCGGDVVVDYVMDDQGIDLTQSPGRDSPVSLSGSAGSGSRHSTASLDSGRASSYLTGASNSSNRSVSGVGSYGVLSSPRCSVSSCSIGSGSGGGVNSGSVGSASHRLSNHSSGNNRCDHDVISDWLMEIHFQEYTYLFLDAGYDLPTIARMTPEDLTAIGIRKPNHRERLKRHIDALKLPDPLPGYVPGSIEEWLRLLRLEEYIQPLLAQGYQTVHDVTQLTWEDLEDIGIVKLGHQKKILLAIKRVKDIINGKMMGGNGGGSSALSAFMSGQSPTVSRSPAVGATVVRAHYDDMSIGLRSESSKQQQHLAVSGSYSTFLRQQPPLTGGAGAEAIYYAQQQQQHSAVAQVHHHQTITYPHVHFDGTHAIYRRSSYDDSDITPTNEKTSALLALSGTGGGDEQQYKAHGNVLSQQQQQHQQWVLHSQKQLQQQQSQTKPPQFFQGGGTLPRQHQRNSYGVRLTLLGGSNQAAQRQRPIAKIVANNLKLPGAASAGGGVSPAIDAGSSVVENSPSGIAGGGPTGYPAEVPLPSILGHIENVEMATAALDAMHFSNYTSLPYAAVQHHQHHAALGFSSDTGDEPSGSPSSNLGYGGCPAPSIAIQQQPIYHNQNMMLQHHAGNLQLQSHHYTHASSSSQSTPSPPTMPTNSVAVGIGVNPHPLSMAPFVTGAYAGQTHQTTVEVHKVSTQHDNKSNSSLESIDQIPFANENAGTIKQRSSLNRTDHQFQHQQQHHAQLLPTPLSSSSTSSSSSSLVGSLITTATTSTLVTGCIPQELSPSATGSVPLSAVVGGANPAGSSATTLPPSSTSSVALPTGACTAESSAPSDDIYGTNVLNDIGNMLANLTDELDAMLEEEKCAGISDIE